MLLQASLAVSSTLFGSFAFFPTFIVFEELRFLDVGTELLAFRRSADFRIHLLT